MKQHLTQNGKIGVMPTDTLYGIVGSALDEHAVERIYSLRRRDPKKPMIILIGDVKDLRIFGVDTPPQIKKILKQWWPGKVSIVLPLKKTGGFLKKFKYLHRGTKTLAFRLPKPKRLRALLRKTGPLVAPSANLAGEPPAKTIRAAKKYFGANVDFYVDAGRRDSKPSTLIAVRRYGKLYQCLQMR